jgi:hypothetical protein
MNGIAQQDWFAGARLGRSLGLGVERRWSSSNTP